MSKILKFTILLIPSLIYSYLGYQWAQNEYHLLTGDEPHYVILAKSIIIDKDIDTKNNEEEDRVSAEIIGPIDSHSLEVGNQRFSVHYIGLPLLLAVPFKIGGLTGVKIFMGLLGGILAFISFYTFRFFLNNNRLSIFYTLVFSLSLPFIPAANQVYPDFPTGLITIFLAYVLFKFEKDKEISLGLILLFMLAGSYLPWLHIKNSAMLVFSLTVYFYSILMNKNSIKEIKKYLIPCLIPIVSLIIFVGFNFVVYGNIKGPYKSDGGLGSMMEFDINKNFMTFLRFHVDGGQGMFVQHPFLLFGLVGWIPFARNSFFNAIVFLGFYFAIIFPNCMHTNWALGMKGIVYSKYCWGAALMWVFPTAYFIDFLYKKGQGSIPMVIGFISLILNYLYFKEYIKEAMIANLIWQRNINPIYRDFESNLPFFNNFDNYFKSLPNQVFIIGFILIFISGGAFVFARMRTGIITLCVLFALSCSVIFPYITPFKSYQDSFNKYLSISSLSNNPGLNIVLNGASSKLNSATGKIEGDYRICKEGIDAAGCMLFGPYITLPKGEYNYKIEYELKNTDIASRWDISLNSDQFGLAGGILSSAHTVTGSQIYIDDYISNLNTEFRIHYSGSGELTIKRIILSPIKFY